MTHTYSLSRETAKPYLIHEDMLESLELYLNRGISGGGFLTAVLENDLREAFGRADDYNRSNLFNIVRYLWNHFPAEAWGSREKVRAIMTMERKSA